MPLLRIVATEGNPRKTKFFVDGREVQAPVRSFTLRATPDELLELTVEVLARWARNRSVEIFGKPVINVVLECEIHEEAARLLKPEEC